MKNGINEGALPTVATKNIVRSDFVDFVDFIATIIVRSLHENYRPPVMSTLLGLL